MYQIRCDNNILYDPRDEELIVQKPKCKLEANTVGEASFTILSNHPYYSTLQKLRSIFEIRQDDEVIFRGRMTNDSLDFYNQLAVDLEGVLAFANDSIIPPFNFPGDFPAAVSAGNMVEYFLSWVLDQHNSQVEEWQRLKCGKVTVSDPNNYISRSSSDYASTWDTLKNKLFESSLGGQLIMRYEEDGNYVDYLAAFEETNTQRITLGENLLDLKSETDATETYSAILPLGAETEDEAGNKSILTLKDMPNGSLTDDLIKDGLFIYSKSAVEQYGWICVPVSESKWDDVTEAKNLQTKAMNFLGGNAVLMSNTITITAVDLSFTDEQIQSFRIAKNVIVDSTAHNLFDASYPLPKLDIDILNPQNTKITIGDTVRTLIDINNQKESAATNRVDNFAINVASKVESEVLASVNQTLVNKEEALLTTVDQKIEAELSGVKSVILFENSEGSNETITLSETSANFSYIEIYYFAGYCGGYTKISAPNGKTISISTVEGTASETAMFRSKYTVSGVTVAPDTSCCGYTTLAFSGSVTGGSGENLIYITKIVGYRVGGD